MKHLRLLFCCIIIAGFGFQGCEKDSPFEPQNNFEVDAPGGAAKVKVMTWNVYVGTDVDVVLESPPEEVPFKVAEAFQMLQSTNFTERAATIAGEIAATRPHLIGLQEISLIRMQTPGDLVVGGMTPAEDVYEDFLQILMDAIADRGMDYQVAGKVENADVEVPMFTGVGSGGPTFSDIRLTDYDVVLVRGDVNYFGVVETNYQAALPIPSLPGMDIPRGYVALTATIGDNDYRFVNTHLEPAWQPIKMAQAAELVQSLENETLPIIMLGDFNTHATYGEAYNYFLDEGYEDVWTHNLLGNAGNGFTAPHDNDLRNETVILDRRIDLVFVRNSNFPGNLPIGPVQAAVIGNELEDRTPSGLWPSDHAGVIATLQLIKP